MEKTVPETQQPNPPAQRLLLRLSRTTIIMVLISGDGNRKTDQRDQRLYKAAGAKAMKVSLMGKSPGDDHHAQDREITCKDVSEHEVEFTIVVGNTPTSIVVAKSEVWPEYLKYRGDRSGKAEGKVKGTRNAKNTLIFRGKRSEFQVSIIGKKATIAWKNAIAFETEMLRPMGISGTQEAQRSAPRTNDPSE